MRWQSYALLLLAGCNGGVFDGGPVRPGPDGRDPMVPNDIPPGCESVTPAARVFANSCAVSGACHVPGGRYPDLTFAALPDLVGASSNAEPSRTLVVPGDLEGSWLYAKVTGTQGPDGGRLMPIGTDEPIDEVSTLAAWIEAGAETTCEDQPPLPVPPTDPNTLDQDELFTCVAPDTSSPARLRRMGRTEWTHAGGHRLGSTAHANPLHAPAGQYSSYAADSTLDPATLDLYLLVAPEAAKLWRERGASPRQYSIYNDRELRCMWSDAAPDDACVDHFVDRLLTVGVLFRTPTDGERSRLRAFLVDNLQAESDPSARPDTLTHVATAAWLMSGALFRSELGEPVDGDPAGRRRLTDDELALALGHVLSSHPPGSSLPHFGDDRPGEPDSTSPELGWLGQVRAAADDGRIQDGDVLRDLLRTYRGGVDLERRDIIQDTDGRDIPARGEHWLAPRIAGFFREWLDYGSADSAFKDHPSATSGWEDDDSDLSYGNLQHGYYGDESTLSHQLDDTIARAVIEAEAAGEDVYRALFTTRMWRLPSNVSAPFRSVRSAHRVYGQSEDVPDTHEGRWVEMPSTERVGVLTHPAWLSAHGGNFEDDASAVLRGRWLRENLYCETVPGLDLVRVEAQLVPSAPELRARDRLRLSIEEGEAAETCMGCHQLMNSLGLPFELYNHAGFLRANDHGQSPDGRSVIDLAPDPSLAGSVAGPMALSEMVAESPYARRCFVRHAFRYFMGRDETMADACVLGAMEEAFEGGSFFAMLEALVTSDGFLYRHLEEDRP